MEEAGGDGERAGITKESRPSSQGHLDTAYPQVAPRNDRNLLLSAKLTNEILKKRNIIDSKIEEKYLERPIFGGGKDAAGAASALRQTSSVSPANTLAVHRAGSLPGQQLRHIAS